MQFVTAAALLLGSMSSTADQPCPVFHPGQPYPWQIKEKMAGDG